MDSREQRSIRTSGSLDFFEGTVRSITSDNKYDIVYDDNDSEEMSEREFAHFSLSMVERVVVVQLC
jgi:hypothetical protein